MKKIDFGEIVNNNFSTDEVIEWLASASMSLASDLATAAVEQNIGKAGACSTAAMTIASVSKALNEKVNGKKTPTVL